MLTCTWNRLMVMKLACRHIRMHFYYETTNKFGPVNVHPARLWVLSQNETESHRSFWHNESCTPMFVHMNRSCAHDLCLCIWLHVSAYDVCEYIICGYAHDLLLCTWPMVMHVTWAHAHDLLLCTWPMVVHVTQAHAHDPWLCTSHVVVHMTHGCACDSSSCSWPMVVHMTRCCCWLIPRVLLPLPH